MKIKVLPDKPGITKKTRNNNGMISHKTTFEGKM
jgi:hypothetical protein